MFNESVSKTEIAVSIIVPVYNVSKYLRQALDSCLNQTFQNFEVICVDDCSTDNSLEILKEYAQNDSRIKVIELEENHGQGYARNYALYKVACGECVMFLDPDDWYEPETLELAYNQIISNNNDFVIFGYKNFDNDTGEFSSVPQYLQPFLDIIDKSNIKLYELNKPFIFSCFVMMMIYKREFLISNKVKCSEDLRMGEDLEFYMNSILNSNSISIINKPLYSYRIHKESTTASKDYLYKEHLISRRRAYDLVVSSGNDYINIFIPYYITSYLYWYKTKLKSDAGMARDYYTEMRKDFIKLRENYDIESFRDYIDYKNFLYICNNNWARRQLKIFIQNIFNIRNSKNKEYKEITIFGMIIKLKKI